MSKTARKDSGYTDDVLDVTRTGDRAWTVHPILGDPTEGAVRTYDNQAGAWHHAVWSRFVPSASVMPKVSRGGNMFDSRMGKGYTSDPRFAAEVPADSVDEDGHALAERLATEFIRAQVGTLTPEDVFSPMDSKPRAPEGVSESQNAPSESLAGEDGATMPPNPHEGVREALSDSERNAWDNFSHMAATAPTEQGRAFWQVKADEIACRVACS